MLCTWVVSALVVGVHPVLSGAAAPSPGLYPPGTSAAAGCGADCAGSVEWLTPSLLPDQTAGCCSCLESNTLGLTKSTTKQ